MASKKQQLSSNFDFDSTEALLEEVKQTLRSNEGEYSPEYKNIRYKLIDEALSTLKSSRHIENCKQQLNENLRYLGDFKMKNGMPQGEEILLIDESAGLIYHGPIHEGLPNTGSGKNGISIEADGSIYLGEWCDGLAVGQGVLVDNLENIFMGEFIHGQLEGRGKELLSNGLVLEGQFTVVEENGKEISHLNGDGKVTVPDGYSFEGKWINGKRQGSGIEKFPEGYVCVGEWRNDYFHNGIIRYNDGTIEEGEFNDNYELEGAGLRIFPSGAKIQSIEGGSWVDGMLQGNGQVLFPEDHEIKEFMGKFEYTRPSGHGFLKFKNGTTQEGNLEGGKFAGIVKLYVPRSYEYEGELQAVVDNTVRGDFVEGSLMPHGKGKILFESGTYYDGEWKAGVPEGQGELYYPEKFHYTGAFVNGKFEGQGSLVSLGTKYSFEGMFKDGKKHGKGKEVLSNNVILEATFDYDEAISIKNINFSGMFNDPSAPSYDLDDEDGF